MNQFIMLGCLWLGVCATAFSQQQTNGVNYQLGPIPSVHKPLAENSVPMQCCPKRFIGTMNMRLL